MTSPSLLTRFREHLLDGGFAPGDRLSPETELAERFQVSRGTIREIIMHLCFSGVLERAPSRGTRVKEIKPDILEEDLAFRLAISRYSFEELKETRLCMETAVLPLMVRRITPEATSILRENIEQMKSLSDAPEEADLLDKEFHLLLLDVCGNRPLRLFSHVIARLFDRAFRDKFLNEEAVLKSVKDHHAILDAILAGDAEQARSVLSSHIAAT
jgi:GntR family transcriptional regulator, transcriptional repressor for pyruvate dehydrogenase complex